MFLSAKAFFEDGTANNTRVLLRAETEIPQDFVRLFKKNVAPLTPMKTGALRRSIITQVIGNKAEISWRVPYAKAQHDGGHTQSHTVRGKNQRDGGFGTIKPGPYVYSRYSKGGGPKFGTLAYDRTRNQMPAIFRQRGYTK